MPIYKLGLERESTTGKGEIYKKIVKQYMDEILGFVPTTDSFYEGHRADIIFVSKKPGDNKEYRLEAKETELKISNQGFISEILNDLLDWLHLAEEKRGNLFVFSSEISEGDKSDFKFDDLFGTQYDNDEILRFVDKYKTNLKPKQQTYLSEANKKEIIDYFSQVKLFVVRGQHLKDIILERRDESSNYILNYAEQIYKESLRLGNPVTKKTTITTNLLSFKPPQKFYSVPTIYQKRQTVWDKYNGKVELPPFLLNPEDGVLHTFEKLTKYHQLSELMNGDVVESDFSDKLSLQFRMALINEHLKRYFWKKGLRRITESSKYYFDAERKDGKITARVIKRTTGKEVQVTKVMPKLANPDEIAYVFHVNSAEIRPVFFWSDYYIKIVPIWEFSEDGTTLFTGSRKDRLDRALRGSPFNRNGNKVAVVRFFEDYLFKSKEFVLPEENWFKEFKFGKLLSLPFDKIPKTYDKKQSVLEEFHQ